MNIGTAAKATGLTTKTIRYYEDIGLVTAARDDNDYRLYTPLQVGKLKFLQRARSLGFTISECRQLLSLYEDKGRASADVKAIATDKIDAISQKISELESLRESLSKLTEGCSGNDLPDCPIINCLAGEDVV